MAESNSDFGTFYRRRQARLLKCLRLRREQLGLSTREIEERIKRKGCKRFDRIESGLDYLGPQEYPYIEQVLKLPPHFLDRLTSLENPYGEATAEEIISQLDNGFHKSETSTSVGASIKICNSCSRQIRRLQKQYALAATAICISDRTCVCGGKQRSDADMVLRMALMLSRVRSLVILGGSEDIEMACKDINGIKITVVLGTQRAGQRICNIAHVDAIIVARGKVTHANTARYSNALKSLKSLSAEKRPIILYPRSSNITSITEEVIRNLDRIAQKTK